MKIYLKKNFKNEKELLKYFIDNYKSNEILTELFYNFKINTTQKDKDKDKNKYIIFIFLDNLIYILNKIYNIQDNIKIDDELCKKLSSIIYDMLKIEEDYKNKQDEYLLRYNIRIFRRYLNQIEINKIDMDDNNNDIEDDKSVFSNSMIFMDYENFLIEEQFSLHFKILEKIFDFVHFFFNKKKKGYFFEFLLNNEILFNSIFVYGFINSKNVYCQKIIFKYLYNSLFPKIKENSQDLISKYLNLIFIQKTFEYILQNDKTGIYFDTISIIIIKTIEEKIKYKCENKHLFQLAIENIIIYIKRNFENKNKEIENEIRDSIASKINLLRNLINLSPEESIPYILDNDIYYLFLEKCIYNKCNEKPLISHNPLCQTYSSQSAIYKLIIDLINQSPDNCKSLYKKIISKLNNFHQLGFWKTNSMNNWKISYNKDFKGDFCGLKNLASTCYLNSIVQMFYNIPMLRESILSIKCDQKFPLLYNLQILFSSLKTYESQYYNPRDFVLLNELNFIEQMDADEFYGRLIDYIEKDINNLYFVNEKVEEKKIEEKKVEEKKVEEKKIEENKEEEKKVEENKEEENKEEIKEEQKKEEIKKEENNVEKTKEEENKKEESTKKTYKSIFKFFFGGNYVDELSFECGHKRYNEFFYNSIQLDIKGFGNLYESLDNYIKIETMEGDNKINCDICNEKKSCNKRQIFKNLPNILLIVLKRFEFDYDNMIKYKLNDYFEFPMILDMKKYLIEDSKEKNSEYDLKGIVIHLGTSECGHYYDLIKTENGKWYEFNDTIVKDFNEKFIPEEAFGSNDFDDDNFKNFNLNNKNNNNNAYILMYQKKNFESDFMNESYQNFSTKLALPPYDKLSNINQNILDIINIEMYQYWVLKNISSIQYQYFVLELVKMDVCRYHKNMKVIQNLEYDSLFSHMITMKKSDFFMENNIQYNYLNQSEPIIKEENDFVFKFYLLYYFNIVIRLKDKNNLHSFTDILKIYINNNLNCAKYIIEEFSVFEVINEYLISSPQNMAKVICGIISQSLLKIYNEIKENDNYIDLYMFSIVLIINDLINNINIEFIYVILFEILCLNSRYRIELINIKYDNYIEYYFENNRKIPENKLYKKQYFSTLKSDHHILSDKSIKSKYIFEEKFTYAEENYENKHQDYIKFNRNDKFFNSIYLLLLNEKNNFSQEEQEENE